MEEIAAAWHRLYIYSRFHDKLELYEQMCREEILKQLKEGTLLIKF
jgi:hypothetical protein